MTMWETVLFRNYPDFKLYSDDVILYKAFVDEF